MTKTEKREHDQKTIKAYNARIDEIDRTMATASNAFAMMLLQRSKRTILRRMIKLYGSEKYGLV